MKPEYAILGAALLVACGPKTETSTEPDNSTAEASITDSASVSGQASDHPVDAVMGYNDGWYLSDGWPGSIRRALPSWRPAYQCWVARPWR